MCAENSAQPSQKPAATLRPRKEGKGAAPAGESQRPLALSPAGRNEAHGGLFRYLQDAVAAICSEFHAEAASIWLSEATSGIVRCVYYDGGRLPHRKALAAPRREYRTNEIPSWQNLSEVTRPTVLRECPRNAMFRHAWEWFAAKRVETTLLIPIGDGKEKSGWLLLFHQDNREYRPADLERAAMRGRQLSLAVRVARAAIGEKQSAILAERERIARELHDTLAQGFTSILLQIEAAKTLLGEDERATLIPLERARDLARESLAEARRAILAMRPRVLGESDFLSALEGMVKDLALGSGVEMKFTVRGEPVPLAVKIETELLRIVQEAVTNALRHAQAGTIRVSLSFQPSVLKASVEDDGCGFSLAEALRGRGFGLTSMRERVENLSGKLFLTSHPSRGTRVLVRIPLQDDRPERG